MQSDSDLIQSAYEDSVKKVYAVFWESLTGENEGDVQAAVERFVSGINLCREVRDLAIKNLPALP